MRRSSGLRGQASVFGMPDGPATAACSRATTTGLVPSALRWRCLGFFSGLLGIIQATEVIKLILGIGDPLVGRLLLVDALGMNFRTLKLRKNPECLLAGTHEIQEADRL